MRTILTQFPSQIDNGAPVGSQSRAVRPRIIAHIDMDAFYASAEAARNPSLAELPVVIGADPKQGKGRGVVISCNYVARKFGLRSAMPISEAWRLCPGAIYVRPDFAYYESLSNDVMNIIRSASKNFEQVSIDEAFVDLEGIAQSFEQARVWVSRLKAQLKVKTGLTCSVGLAGNKSAAKIATDLHKPDGITVILPSQTKETLSPLPVSVIPGVGIKTELALKGIGVSSVGDLQRLDAETVKRRLGRSGVWLWEVANGLESEDVREHELKSLSTERTLEHDTQDWPTLERLASDLASELGTRSRLMRMEFRKVGIKIRFRGFETHTREIRLAKYSNSGEVISREALALLREFQENKMMVRLIGLRVSELKLDSPDQTSMTDWVESDAPEGGQELPADTE